MICGKYRGGVHWEIINLTKDHHWIGPTPNPHDYFGFIYEITDETSGKKYIGKKQYWMAKRVSGCRAKVSDRQSKKWKPNCWRESDWRTYEGSSKTLKGWMKDHPDHKYSYRIIRQCRSRGTLHYAEVEALVKSGAIWRLQESTGDHLYFNRQIPATRFRPVAEYAEEYWEDGIEWI